jgi:hypothetical protein
MVSECTSRFQTAQVKRLNTISMPAMPACPAMPTICMQLMPKY